MDYLSHFRYSITAGKHDKSSELVPVIGKVGYIFKSVVLQRADMDDPYYPCMCVIGARDVVEGDSPPAARPQHFWACELGDADGKGSPILHEYAKKSAYFTLKNGDKVRGNTGDCLLL